MLDEELVDECMQTVGGAVMKVLVTGGAGFIGSHLVERLVTEGHEVRVVDNFSTGRRESLTRLGREVELIEGDIQSYERAHNAVRNREVVFHQAALPSVPRSVQDPLTTNASNVIGTLNVLLAARDSGVRRVVFASSSSVYGANSELPKSEQMRPVPISPYAVGKLAAEGYCRSFYEVYGLETVALRYFNTFGPRQDPLSQYAAVIPRFLTAALSAKEPVVYGDGHQSRDFTYVANVVDANLLAANVDGVAGRVYNIASGSRLSVNDVLERLHDLTGREFEPRYEPARPGEVRHSEADISAAQAELGYRLSVGFDEGLEQTMTDLEDQLLARSERVVLP